jgi:two-component system CheB/CheR fusion protein
MRRFAFLARTRVRAAIRQGGRSKKTTVGTSVAPAARARAAGAGVGRAMSTRGAEEAAGLVSPAIVGLGSSAGGLDALRRFFTSTPSDSGMAFVLVQHLDPTHPSQIVELLGRCTAMSVVQVEADTPVEADHVYCMPPGRYLSISGRTLRLTEPVETGSVRMPIDFFLRSLGADARERGIGIILSGTGTDGTLGLRAIKAAGGLAIAQDPVTAEHDGMPRSAIADGAIDHVLSPEQMPDVLLGFLRHPSARGPTGLPAAEPIEHDRLDDVLAVLRERTKFDFRSYKRSTLERRIDRRMGLKHSECVADYAQLLRHDSAEVAALCDELLISVTSFFRDPEAWRILQEQVIRPLVARKEANAAFRVWVPGCATGEEAYSIAMLLIAEREAAAKSCPIQIFASDVDTGALEVGRAGLYPEGMVAAVPAARRHRFFIDEKHGARVGKELRESVVFARQNLLADPPFSRLDLICCRNLLMYLEPEAQRRILSLLHFALVEGGHLFLGTAETIGQQEDLFAVVSKHWRIYRRIGPTQNDKVRFPVMEESALGRRADQSPLHPRSGRLGALVQQVLTERFVPACVLIDRKYEILYFAGPTQDYLIQPTGVPTEDLMSRLRDGLPTKLRGAIRRAIREGERPVVITSTVRRGEMWHPVKVTVEPLAGIGELEGFLLISFADEPQVTPPILPSASAAGGHDDAVTRQLEDELETTREELQGSIGDLESSNEELKVVNEEVMSVNEELRSSNEELETSKEELQSLNEELSTVNTQLEDKVAELEQANNDLDNLLTSTNIATIFLDANFHVRRFTPAATRLFTLTPAHVGRRIGDVVGRGIDPDLPQDSEAVLARLGSISKEVQGPDGRWYVRQALPYRTRDNRIEGVVITFSDVAAEALQEARLYAEAIVNTVREPLLVLDSDLRVLSANRSFYQTFRLSPEETVDRALYELNDGELDVPRLRALLGVILPDRGSLTDFEIEHDFARIGRRIMLLNARILARGGDRPDLILLAMEDISERKRAEHALRESEAMTRAGIEAAVDGVVTTDVRGTVLSFNPAAELIFGYSGGEVIGQNVRMLVPPSYLDEYEGSVARFLETVDGRVSGLALEIRGQHKNGTTFPMDLNLSEFDDGAGRRFVGTIRDITERKWAEDEVRRRQAELAHVLRIATIERLAASLAHELNQPLTAIANEMEACATYVRSGKREPRHLLSLLERAGAEALRAGEIVHHLRDFVLRSEPRLEPADLCEVIRNATRWLAREMEHERITLRLDLAPQGLQVDADRIQIEQVLVNIVQNAIDAIREARGETREIRVRTSQGEDGTAEVFVDDTGIGLAAAVTARLYEPFFTTKPHGMGMGLAISRTIVELHHGRLSVGPRESGPGTTVRLVLPVSEADESPT